MDAGDIETYLKALSDQLGLQGKNDAALVVCGGAALSSIGLSQRTTRDIDILALMVDSPGIGHHLVKAEFDDEFKRACSATIGTPHRRQQNFPLEELGYGDISRELS